MFKKARPIAGEDVEKQQLRTPSENKEGSAVSLNKCERRLFFLREWADGNSPFQWCLNLGAYNKMHAMLHHNTQYINNQPHFKTPLLLGSTEWQTSVSQIIDLTFYPEQCDLLSKMGVFEIPGVQTPASWHFVSFICFHLLIGPISPNMIISSVSISS